MAPCGAQCGRPDATHPQEMDRSGEASRRDGGPWPACKCAGRVVASGRPARSAAQGVARSGGSGVGGAGAQARHALVEAKRIQELERELRRKDHALAETAALLVLKKKLEAIWGDADATTDARNEP